MQESLQRQMRGEMAEKETQLQQRHDDELEQERRAAAARLLQTSKRLGSLDRHNSEKAVRKAGKSNAQKVEEITTELQSRLDKVTRMHALKAAELQWVQMQMATLAHGLVETPKLLGSLLQVRLRLGLG